MRYATGSTSVRKFVGIGAVLVGSFLAFPICAEAQGQGSQGQNAVCTSIGEAMDTPAKLVYYRGDLRSCWPPPPATLAIRLPLDSNP
jgi:hypothetical protein